MAITPRKSTDGKRTNYLVRVESIDPVTGKRRRVNKTCRTRKEAEKLERELLVQRDGGTLVDPADVTVSQLLDDWLRSKRSEEISSQTLVDYEITIRKHLKPAVGAIKVQKLTPARLQSQYATWTEQGLSARVIRGAHMRLSQALDQAVKFNMVARNVCDSVTPPKVVGAKTDVWTPHEAATFLEASERDWLHPLWHFLVLEGMRRGEALGLRWKDVNWERGSVHIMQSVAPDKANKGKAIIQRRTKTAAGARQVRLTTQTLDALRQHRRVWLERKMAAPEWNDNDLIICTSRGTPVNPNNVSRNFNALVERAGLRRIRVHDLRHTAATLLLKAGVPAKVVSERLGHAKIGITLDLYSHVLPDMQDDAAEAMSKIFTRPS